MNFFRLLFYGGLSPFHSFREYAPSVPLRYKDDRRQTNKKVLITRTSDLAQALLFLTSAKSKVLHNNQESQQQDVILNGWFKAFHNSYQYTKSQKISQEAKKIHGLNLRKALGTDKGYLDRIGVSDNDDKE